LRTIDGELRLQVVKHFLGEAERICRRLDHQGRHRADQRCLARPALTMPAQIMRDFTTSGRMADVNRVLQVEMRGERSQVVCIMVHIVTVGGLRRTSVATPVVGDYAITTIQEEQHLCVPIVGR
jgi:hypothetical protein